MATEGWGDSLLTMEKSFQLAQWKELEGKSTADDKLLEERVDPCPGDII